MSQGFNGLPNILGLLRATALKVLGKPGTTQPVGLAGGTASGAPTSGTFDTLDIVADATGALWICTAGGSPGTWAQVSGGGGFTNPMTAQDDLIIGGAAGAATRLAKGASGNVLTVDSVSGHLAWDAPAGGSTTLAGDTDVAISSPTGGQVLAYNSSTSKWQNQAQAGVAATTITGQLGADVAMASANTYYDGPTVTVPAGTWLLTGTVTLLNATATDFTAQLWDGTTVYGSSQQARNTGTDTCSIALSAVVKPTATTTYKISAAGDNTSSTIKAATVLNAAGNTASTLTAIQLSGNPVGQQAPAVRCYNSAAISIATSTDTTLTFDSNSFDQGTSTPQHSTSSNTSRLTCQQSGVYQITASLSYVGNATGSYRDAWIMLNGATRIAEYNAVPDSQANRFEMTALYRLNVGDYLEVHAYQDSGGALNIDADTGGHSPVFMMARVDSGPPAVQPNTKVQLDYAASTDIANGVTLTTNTWVDIGTNQTFTVDDPASVIEIAVSGNILAGGGTSTQEIGSRIVIDSAGTPINKQLAGGWRAASTYTNALAGANTVDVTGLSAGSHTIKVQVQSNAATNSDVAYCRASTMAAFEALQIRVLERKQSTSPPSSTPAPAVRAYNSTDTSIANSAWTALALDSTLYDQGTSTPQHSTTTNTSRLTCQQAGVYSIVGHALFVSNATGVVIADIYLNGTTFIGRTEMANSSAGTPGISVSTQYKLNVGDYIELRIFQSSGAALTLYGNTNSPSNSSHLEMARVDTGGTGAVYSPQLKTASYTILPTDSMVVANAASLTFTLPSPSSYAGKAPLVIKNNNQTTTVVKTDAAGHTIDGTDYSTTGYALNTAYGVLRLATDGNTSWYSI